MIIEKTATCESIFVKNDIYFDLHQTSDWVQLDEEQAAQLIEMLQKWLETRNK